MFPVRPHTRSALAAAALAFLTPAAFAQRGGGGHGGGHGGGRPGGYSGGYSGGGRAYSAPSMSRGYSPGTVGRPGYPGTTVNRAPVSSGAVSRPPVAGWNTPGVNTWNRPGATPGLGLPPGQVVRPPVVSPNGWNRPGTVPGWGRPPGVPGGWNQPWGAPGWGRWPGSAWGPPVAGGWPVWNWGWGIGWGWARPIVPGIGWGWGWPGGGMFVGFGSPWVVGYRPMTVIGSGFGSALPAALPVGSVVPQTAVQPAVQPDPAPPAGPVDFASQAADLFRAGQYLDAATAYRHAAVDQPQNGALAVQAAFALIGAGKLDEAAGAAQTGLSQLPPEQWAGAAKQAGELFPSRAAFDQVALAAARASDKSPADPGTRFATGLVAFGRGEMARAASDFDAVLKVAPQDAISKKLRELTGVR